MPRIPRNLARERAQADATAPQRQLALYSQLTSTLPERHVILIGGIAIRDHLNALGIRKPSGRPLTWTLIRRWRLKYGFPLIPGNFHAPSRHRTPPATSNFAVLAWLLTRHPADRIFTTYPTADPTQLPQASQAA